MRSRRPIQRCSNQSCHSSACVRRLDNPLNCKSIFVYAVLDVWQLLFKWIRLVQKPAPEINYWFNHSYNRRTICRSMKSYWQLRQWQITLIIATLSTVSTVWIIFAQLNNIVHSALKQPQPLNACSERPQIKRFRKTWRCPVCFHVHKMPDNEVPIGSVELMEGRKVLRGMEWNTMNCMG